jgi:hypothetical protein
VGGRQGKQTGRQADRQAGRQADRGRQARSYCMSRHAGAAM